MKRRSTWLFAAALATTSATGLGTLAISCTDNTGYGLTSGTGGHTSTGGVGGLTGTGGAGASVGGLDLDAAGCENKCSPDLQQILTCDGKFVAQCDSDKGCSNGKCTEDPCAAAEKAQSSFGCDYYALKTGLLPQADGACFAAFIANTWSVPVKINVEYDGMSLPMDFAYVPTGQGSSITYMPYDQATGLGPGEVAVLFLARNQFGFVVDCPKPAAISDEVGVADTGIGKAFHITTDYPVVAYQILPYGGGPSAFSSATLLFPTSAWGTNYVAINAYKNATKDPNASPLIDILASQDGTTVTILPKTNIVGGSGVAPATANTKTDYTLNKGEFLQIEQPEELSGSPIQSDKPIAVWGGHSCLYMPTDKNACDSAQQQLPPVKALGNEYVGVRYRGRTGGGQTETSVPWRIVGAVNGTKLTWSPSKPANAPETLELGTVLEFDAGDPFVVKAQDEKHPFFLSEYMTGGELFDSEGDPDWVSMVPPAQFLSSYVLFTDPTYSETNLVIVRQKAQYDNAFHDVFLDCMGKIEGFQTIGDYEYTRVDLETGNFMEVNGCSNGRHEMHSQAPFGVTVWGWGSKAAQGTKLVSYAYPAGASIQPINDVQVLPDPQ